MDKFFRLLYWWLCFVSVAAAQQTDSITTIIAAEYDQVGAVHRFWFGDSYRKLYNTPVKMRVVDLSKEKGGLTVVKLGGGMQTQSLRMVDPTGREWVLRSIQKFPERSLPESLRKTIAKDIVQDQISIAHPFGALTVPPFNRALEIPHVMPELIYVGDDVQLGEYRDVFKNRPYMFEARMPFADEKTDNTEKVIRKLLEDNDVEVDQKLTLRARFLDMLLGDWDRHEDNWRWDPEKDKGKKTYTPVPRDRDKVYYKTSGVFPVLLSYQWLKAHLQPFSPHIRNVAHWNFNARHFDRFFLYKLDKEAWRKEIRYMQDVMTDSLIHEAMLAMPDTIVKLSAAEMEYNVRSRRDELLSTGLEYYSALSRVVDVPLSAKTEFIDVTYQQDGAVHVLVRNKKKDGSVGRTLMDRNFSPTETKEVRIYGLSGEDEYRVQGAGKSPIRVRLIGGKQYDRYAVSEEFKNGKRLYIYDSKDASAGSLVDGRSIRYRLDKDTAVHRFAYDNFVYDRKGMLVNFNYGIDRGLILGAGYVIENQGFRKSPFAYRHTIMANYLTGRKSFMFDYKGEFKKLVAGQDLVVNVSSLGPKNLSNFFGYGNETVFEKGEERGIDYYRNRYDVVSGDIFLAKRLLKNMTIYYGSSSEFYTSSAKNNEERFLEDYQITHPEEAFFGSKWFTGASVGAILDTRDHKTNPKSGIFIETAFNWKAELGGGQKSYTSLKNVINVYHTLGQDRLTIANRTGLDAVWGAPYFFQHAQIGGENSLRGYNSRRFTGQTAVYNNLETRLKLFSFNSYLIPGTMGLLTFYDVGRVWMREEKSHTWHSGYGGGLYFMPGDLLLIQAAFGFSKEATLPYIRIGLSF